MTSDSLAEVKARLSEYVDRVQREHERVAITKRGKPAAILMSPEDLEELEETLAILSDNETVRRLSEAEQAIASGDVIGETQLRALQERLKNA